MADFQKQAGDLEDDLTEDASNLTAGGLGAVVAALDGDVGEAAGAEALGRAGRSEADFVGEVAVADGG